ncbi:MAG: helix-turn-helix domain-containing protein [Acidimicrobiia bacterium]|nr:helix-turn-helix domain-containing protein [Acidimicrobiia bacterium]
MILSPIEGRLARAFVERFGEVVAVDVLMEAAWADKKASPGSLRVHLTRLRKAISALGLEILAVRAYGYVLQEVPEALGAI